MSSEPRISGETQAKLEELQSVPTIKQTKPPVIQPTKFKTYKRVVRKYEKVKRPALDRIPIPNENTLNEKVTEADSCHGDSQEENQNMTHATNETATHQQDELQFLEDKIDSRDDGTGEPFADMKNEMGNHQEEYMGNEEEQGFENNEDSYIDEGDQENDNEDTYRDNEEQENN